MHNCLLQYSRFSSIVHTSQRINENINQQIYINRIITLKLPVVNTKLFLPKPDKMIGL